MEVVSGKSMVIMGYGNIDKFKQLIVFLNLIILNSVCYINELYHDGILIIFI